MTLAGWRSPPPPHRARAQPESHRARAQPGSPEPSPTRPASRRSLRCSPRWRGAGQGTSRRSLLVLQRRGRPSFSCPGHGHRCCASSPRRADRAVHRPGRAHAVIRGSTENRRWRCPHRSSRRDREPWLSLQAPRGRPASLRSETAAGQGAVSPALCLSCPEALARSRPARSPCWLAAVASEDPVAPMPRW